MTKLAPVQNKVASLTSASFAAGHAKGFNFPAAGASLENTQTLTPQTPSAM